MITAPFNFVPVSETVFFPKWAEDVSHDIPFEDGESGVIDITITAKSPLFIRDTEDKTVFCNHKGTHYIPSTSLKGMVRSVLEIMSFSKMKEVYDTTYAIRDLHNHELYMSKMTIQSTFCGWLKKVDNGYVIEDCGKPGRIKHSEIDKIFKMDFASKFTQKINDKTANMKYDMLPSKQLEHHFEYVKKDYDRDIYRYAPQGKKKGTLVFTGQPSPRKVYEFVFFEKKSDIELSQKVMDNFLFAYFDNKETEPKESKESKDWTCWKKKLENGDKVPVFFHKKDNEVIYFGLSYLYKLPYTYSVKDGLPPAHHSAKKDLAETIFGYVEDKDALKGRVQFSHAKIANTPVTLAKVSEILGTPRASYYPMYIAQNGGRYKTFMDDGFRISGWKRYPVHKNKPTSTKDTGNDSVKTTFKPLKEGVVFKSKLRYHNLKPVEIGALLSALSFHNNAECFHSIGLAKSLGYGKIKVDIAHHDTEQYLKEFELMMRTELGTWATSPQLKELFTMASEQDNRNSSALRYMELPQFSSVKKDSEYLRHYTKLENIIPNKPTTLISEEEIQQQKEKLIAQIALKKAQEKEKRERQEKEDKEMRLAIKEKEKQEKEAKRKQLEEEKKAREEEEKENRLSSGLDFSEAQDYKGIERSLKGHPKTDENISKLETCIKDIYPSLNAKKSKQFARSKEIEKWLTKEKFSALLQSLNT